MAKRDNTQRLDALLGSITDEMLTFDPQQFTDNSLRVERILLEMVRPDPVQPRRVLPESIHFEFHNNRMTPTQALRQLVQTVQIAARQRGRPFNSVLELVAQGEDEQSEGAEIRLSPEEQLLHDLVNLAITIRDDGQVNPLTVVDVSQGAMRLYRIETGERRYWATWLLRDFIPEYSGDGMIPCIIIPAAQSSVFRQAKENTARSGLSAIAMARQAALLLLTVHGCEIPAYAVGNDFYRQALNLDLRGKREYTDAILSAMGGISRSQFSRLKSLLTLSDEALELADRHDVDEGKLRYVVEVPSEAQCEAIQQIVAFDLTVKQIKDMLSEAGEPSTEPTEEFPKDAVRLTKLLRNVDRLNSEALARTFVHQERDVQVARARLRSLRSLLDEAERHLANM
ncbi:MAG TPA: ParB N-terminal domain-containing protein [Aggregatilineales bacterium]|nr:ParB N-terminal domain-containing protein [Aggregatilineales bacterium]